MPTNGAGMTARERLTSPRIGGTQFFTPDQMYWRRRAIGRNAAWFATPRTGATSKVTRMVKYPTGAARMESLDSTDQLYISALGDWGRTFKVGRRP
jgi:hypothetical protein